MEVLQHRQHDLGNGRAVHGHPRQAAGGERGQPHRPFGGALLRHGRRVPGPRRHAGRDRGHARHRPRGPDRPGRWGCRCRKIGAITIRRGSIFRRSGPRKPRSSRSRMCSANSGVGTIQSGGGRDAELDNRLMTRLAEACGRQVVYNNLGQSVRQPEAWKQHMALVDETAKAGIRANPLCTPNSNTTRFTMRNTQAFRGIPTWHPILLADDEEKLRAYSDPAVRQQIAPGSGGVDGGPARREPRPAVVRLYLGGRDDVAQEPAVAGQIDPGNGRGAGQGHHRRLPGSGGRGGPGYGVPGRLLERR